MGIKRTNLSSAKHGTKRSWEDHVLSEIEYSWEDHVLSETEVRKDFYSDLQT